MARAALVLGVWAVVFLMKSIEFLSDGEVYKSYLFSSGGMLKVISHNRKQSEDYVEPNCRLEECSWLSYQDNAEFEASHPRNMPLYEEADVDIQSKQAPNDPAIRCIPESFGYTKEQAAKVFPDVDFPSCGEVNDVKHDIIKLDPATDLLTMTCPGWYWLGNGAYEELLGKEPYLGTRVKYTGPVKLRNQEEWAFGTCDNDKTTRVEGATYSHRPNPEAVQRAQATMEVLQQEAAETSGSKQTKPLSVIMLTLDSVSRRQFYRKLPQTKAFLESVDPQLFRVFDFKIHNVMGDNSLPNVWPVFTGKAQPNITESKRNRYKEMVEDLVGRDAIWHYLKQQVGTT
jgi:hypothetical protein